MHEEENEFRRENDSIYYEESKLEETIKKGWNKSLKNQRKRILSKSIIIILPVFIIFIMSINFSPAFADFVRTIPGFEYIVNIVQFDKGLQLAVENNYVQHIDQSATKEDITFTVKDIIVDNDRMIIFYRLEGNGRDKRILLKNVSILDEDGEVIKAGYSYGSGNDNFLEKKYIEGRIDVFNIENKESEKVVLKLNLLTGDERKQEFEMKKVKDLTIPIEIDREYFKRAEKKYEINQWVEVEGQRIHFMDMTIYPTRIALHVKYDPSNKKKILEFRDLVIEDEKGEFPKITNGSVGRKISDDEEIIYMQSDFFNAPEKIKISGSKLMALDKDKMTVEIDLDQKKIIKAPDSRLKLLDITTKEEQNNRTGENEKFRILFFELEGLVDQNYHYNIFKSDMIINGKKYESNRSGSGISSLENGVIYEEYEQYFKEDEGLKGIGQIEIYQYPSFIETPFEIYVTDK